MTKRLFDLFCSLAGIIVLLPIFFIVGLVIKLDSKGNIFFTQERVGRYGLKFSIIKFRTMYVCSEDSLRLTVGRDPRITKIGAVLRHYKIDELPQLFNVLIGNMSLVGPRPEVQEYVDTYNEFEKLKILSVRPGITDLASIEMIEESVLLAKYEHPQQAYIEKILPVKKKLSLAYIEKRSFYNDLLIIFNTIFKILK